MKSIVMLLVLTGMLVGGGFDSSKVKNGDFHLYTVENKNLNINPKAIEDALKSKGFVLAENVNIQEELHSIYGDENFKIYNHISFYHKAITLKILNKHANAGILVPMGIVVYQGINEDNLHIVVPRAEMQARVIGANPESLIKIEEGIVKVIQTLFPKAIHTYSAVSKPQKEKRMTKYSLDIKDADFEDAREELEEEFEEKFADAGFAMPGYFDLTDDLSENSPYDFYVTYAICKIDVLRIVVKVNPESAALGPCTTVLYKKKNEQKIVMGFASIYNWISSANIEDKVLANALLDTQKVYEAVLKDVTKN